VTLADGKKLDWSYDGPYDGKLQKREWMSFAFKRVKPNAFSNDYIMNDGTKGHEVATVATDNITIRGSSWARMGRSSPMWRCGQGTLIRNRPSLDKLTKCAIIRCSVSAF